MKRKNLFAILCAICLVGIGALLLCVNLLNIPFDLLSGWWTLLLMAVALSSMVSSGFRFGNGMLLGTAILLLLRVKGIFITSWHQFAGCVVALVLIMLGVSLIIGMFRRKDCPAWSAPPEGYAPPFTPPQSADSEARAHQTPYNGEAFPNRVAIFSNEACRSDCKAMRGGRFTAVFGSVVADLRQADFTHPISIECYSIFGGIDLYAPPHVRVECTGTPIFGSCDASAVAGRPHDPAHPVLTVKYVSVFGGLKVM